MKIYPTFKKFRGTFVSVWFDEKFSFYCKEKPNTVNNEAPKYYIPLVFDEYKTLKEIKDYIDYNILTKYGVELAKWDKSIHVKHIYQVIDPNCKILEVWTEHNYNGNEWKTICEWDEKPAFYELSEGLACYTNYPYRFVGSLFTLNFIILFSNYEHQYLLLKKIEE